MKKKYFLVVMILSWLVTFSFAYDLWNPTQFFKQIFLTSDGSNNTGNATIVLDGVSGSIKANNLDVKGSAEIGGEIKVNKICDINGQNCKYVKDLGKTSQIVSVCNTNNIGKANQYGQICECIPTYISVTRDTHCINAKEDNKNWYDGKNKYKCANGWIYVWKTWRWWGYRRKLRYVGYTRVTKYNCSFSNHRMGVLTVNKLGTNGLSPTSGYPRGWGGGIHTWDVYAEGTIGVGSKGQVMASMDRYGTIKGKRLYVDGNIDVKGSLRVNRICDANGRNCKNVNNGWCFYTNYSIYKKYKAANGYHVEVLKSPTKIKVDFYSDDLYGWVKFYDEKYRLIAYYKCGHGRDGDDRIQHCIHEVPNVKYIKWRVNDAGSRSPVRLDIYVINKICLR